MFQKTLPASSPVWADTQEPWPDPIRGVLESAGVSQLYRHQATAIDLIRKGLHVIVATPTASGKTMVYNLPVLERYLADADATALYIFPLKALAQDQLQTFEALAAHLGASRPTAAIYDGDTSAYHRRRIREAPPNVILTNPEMLHLSFLAHHRKWAAFLSRLHMVVVDEVHTYRGVMGSHVAQIFRRFHRICRLHKIWPTFVFSSATVSNPEQLANQLSGLKVETIDKNGAPRGIRRLLFFNPELGPARAAILLLKAALQRGLRTIVYTQSRKLTELIAMWAGSDSGAFAGRISAYRAGLLPAERRDIEARLANGELLAVIATSALELGIDIGDLDLCLLVGYPGSVISTWQRGGRVGRSGQESALVLIAGEDAIDQYFMRNPQDFIDREPEAAVINPFNAQIMNQHLVCAAAELTLKADEPLINDVYGHAVTAQLIKDGRLLKSADGTEIYAWRRAPHRDVDMRGAGKRFQIVDTQSERLIGEIDDYRAFRETHPGAVYLHRGDTFIVDRLDIAKRTAAAYRAKVDYYTRVRGHKQTEILKINKKIYAFNTEFYEGIIKVTDQVTEFEKWHISTKTLIKRISLELPPQVFETRGLWFQIPKTIQQECESGPYDLMGALHAIEHAAIGILPLLVMADHRDVGGMSTNYHPQIGGAVIFIYDGIPGGAGLTLQAFSRAQDLIHLTLNVIRSCPCESGCPSCIHSPQCGSGNRPMDKNGAIFILEQMKPKEQDRTGAVRFHPAEEKEFHTKHARTRKSQPDATESTLTNESPVLHFGVLDLETQRSAAEVGGWHRADRMGISCAVLYDSSSEEFLEFLEDQIPRLIQRLTECDLIVGFNIRRFDYLVMRGYTNFDFSTLNTLDVLEEVHHHLGFRLSLAHLAQETLGATKTGDGLQALRWWQEGRIREILDYCRMDVKLTRDLFLFGRRHGHLIFRNRNQKRIRIPVCWDQERLQKTSTSEDRGQTTEDR